MKLITTTRIADHHLRVDVQGRWEYNDALALAYQIKALAARAGNCHVLLDLRNVTPSAGVEGRFLLWDRLHRVLAPGCKVAVLAPVGLVDLKERPVPGTARVVLFATERSALTWLEGSQTVTADSGS